MHETGVRDAGKELHRLPKPSSGISVSPEEKELPEVLAFTYSDTHRTAYRPGLSAVASLVTTGSTATPVPAVTAAKCADSGAERPMSQRHVSVSMRLGPRQLG